jgi:hypothetical protein
MADMKTKLVVALAALSIVGFVGAGSTAPKPPAVCWMDPSPMTVGGDALLWGTGLPTKTALNVFITDSGETYGFPVGMHPDGIMGVGYSPEHEGTITAQITGPERGRTKVYATCTGEVQAAG